MELLFERWAKDEMDFYQCICSGMGMHYCNETCTCMKKIYTNTQVFESLRSKISTLRHLMLVFMVFTMNTFVFNNTKNPVF